MFAQTTTHATLLARIAKGDDVAAWREFHDRYRDLIHGFARRRGLQPSDCEDVTQEVLLSLSKALPGFAYDPAKGKFRSYLKTIVLRTIFRRRCQKAGEQGLTPIEEADRAAERDTESDSIWELEWRQYHMRQALRAARAEFNDTDLAAFQAYAVESQDVQTVAQTLGLSTDQVYQAKSRILKRLSSIIAQQVAEEG